MGIVKETEDTDIDEMKDADILRDILRDFDSGLLAQRGVLIIDEVHHRFTKSNRQDRYAENYYYLACEDRDTSTDEVLSFWHGLGLTPEKAHEYALHLGFPESLKEIQEMFAELTALVG